MYNVPYMQSFPYGQPYVVNVPLYDDGRGNLYWPTLDEMGQANPNPQDIGERIRLEDYGKQPFVIDIEKAAERNKNFRTALWTGDHLQVTLMRIGVGEDIGLEVHPTVDQFLRIEEGKGMVQMGDTKDNLYYQRRVDDDFAIMVPAGTWHNITNTGHKPLKLYTIYAPPEHQFGTVHRTKSEAT